MRQRGHCRAGDCISLYGKGNENKLGTDFLGHHRQWRLGCSNPPEIPKALQNRAKLNPIVKTIKNC